MERPHETQPDDSDPQRQLPLWHEKATPGTAPRLWVGSLIDFHRGSVHGSWIEAAQPAHQLRASIHRMLDASPTAAERGEPVTDWEVFASEGFGNQAVPARPDLRTLSRLARGIAAHGPAFAAWSEIVGDTNQEAQNRFQDVYLGHYQSIQDFGRDVLTRTGLFKELDTLPDAIRRYLDFSWDRFARDIWESNEYLFAPAPGGGVYVFDARA